MVDNVAIFSIIRSRFDFILESYYTPRSDLPPTGITSIPYLPYCLIQKPLFLLLSAFGLLASIHVTSASTGTPGIMARQANERARIRQDVISDELSLPEVARLKTC